MEKNEKIDYLLKAIEDLIDAKANTENGGFTPVYQARADVREALELILED